MLVDEQRASFLWGCVAGEMGEEKRRMEKTFWRGGRAGALGLTPLRFEFRRDGTIFSRERSSSRWPPVTVSYWRTSALTSDGDADPSDAAAAAAGGGSGVGGSSSSSAPLSPAETPSSSSPSSSSSSSVSAAAAARSLRRRRMRRKRCSSSARSRWRGSAGDGSRPAAAAAAAAARGVVFVLAVARSRKAFSRRIVDFFALTFLPLAGTTPPAPEDNNAAGAGVASTVFSFFQNFHGLVVEVLALPVEVGVVGTAGVGVGVGVGASVVVGESKPESNCSELLRELLLRELNVPFGDCFSPKQYVFSTGAGAASASTPASPSPPPSASASLFSCCC